MSIRRLPLFALSLFLALLLVPSRAYAWDVLPKGVLYSTDLDGSRVGYVVSAYNQFDAACYALGKDPNTISSDVKQKLSDSNYGGRFYDYAQSFFTQSGGLENVPTWVPAYVILISELGDLVLSDYQGVWYSTATKSLYDGAMVDFVRVLNGEDLGGGSGGSPAPDLTSSYVLDTLYGYYPNDTYSNWLSPSGSVTVRFSNIDAVRSQLQSLGCSYFYPVCCFYFFYGGSTWVYRQYITYVASDSPVTFDFSSDLSRADRRMTVTCSSDGTIYYARTTNNPSSGSIVVSTNPSATFNATYTVSSLSFSPAGSSYVIPVSIYEQSRTCYLTQAATVSSIAVAPPPPAGTWPEPSSPAAPVEPTFPDPTTPTVQPDPVVTEPTVTWPSPTITIDPDPVPGTTPTGLDYTELLTRINDNLISIDSFARAINSNLNSLRSDLVNEFDGVVQSLRNIYTYLQHMDDVLERHCVHLQNKLEDVSVDIQNKIREMVRWLADELDFDSEESGNSDLFGILSTISDKLGGGTYEPNPIRDELGYYEWLDNLWDRFLLGDNWQASAGSISQSFGQLTSRFPFSVPWDIVALFRLFVHDPVTPVFDLPLYYSADDYATVHVDLSGWDGVAAVVRPLVFVIFALNLALLSRHLLAGFGADKGGL